MSHESRPEIRFALTVRMPSKCAVAFVHVIKVTILHLSSDKVKPCLLGLKKFKCLSIVEVEF